jgi:KaiC/GvpD/RAD55 family RecA-like ATPase
MEFLKNFKDPVFQVFADKKDIRSFAKIYETFDIAEFSKLNNEGYGIYFTPNGFKGGRKLENLTSLNAIYADLDLAKEGQVGDIRTQKANLLKALRSHVPPNFVIDTKNGFQPIWFIEATIDQTELYVKVIKGIIEWSKQFGCAGDAVYDVTRVLRLPNFYHQKSDPYLCRAIALTDPELAYSLEDLEKFFPYSEPEAKAESPKKDFTQSRPSPILDAINAIDFETLIIAAFGHIGRTADFDAHGRLILDSRLTGTFKGRLGGDFLASTSHEPFTGNRVTAVADILGVSNKEAMKWIRETFNLDQSMKREMLSKAEEVKPVFEEPVEAYMPYTWGTEGLDAMLWSIKPHEFGILTGETSGGKSAFALFLAKQNAKICHKILYINLEMKSEEFLAREARKYANVTIKEYRTNKIPKRKRELMAEKIKEFTDLENLEIIGFSDETNKTIELVFAKIEEKKPTLVIIDNLDKLDISDGIRDKWANADHVSNKLVFFTNSHNIPVVLIHHYAKSKGSSRGIESLRGSAKLGHDADWVMLLERDMEAEPGSMESSRLTLKIIKHRATGEFRQTEIFYQSGDFSDDYSKDLAMWNDLIEKAPEK